MRERVEVPALRVDPEDLPRELDALTLAVARRLAAGAADPGQLCAAVQGPRVAVFERVLGLHRLAALDTPRSRDQAHLAAAGAAGPTPAALRFPGGLKHRCVSCGSSCTGSDLGPLTDSDIARLEVLEPARRRWLGEVRDTHGGSARVLKDDGGRCVNLRADLLCGVHVAGEAADKPGFCRQFPLVFVRTPRGIDVSFAMECRSWTRARVAGEPTAAREGELRALLADGATVLDLEVPVRLGAGLAIDFEAWEELRREMLGHAASASDLGDLADAVADPVLVAVDRALEPYADSELFATREGWGIPAPADDLTHRATRFMETCGRVSAQLVGGLGELARHHQLAGSTDRVDRTQLLRRVLTELLSGRPPEPVSRPELELELHRDLVMAALHAHEPARRGGVLLGAALLNLKLIACHRGAGLVARAASRAAVTEQDVVDTMVLLTKMLRGTSTLGVVRHPRDELAELFLQGSRVFTRGQAPRARGMRPLPGA